MLYEICRFISYVFMWLGRYKIVNKEKLKQSGNCLICSNHISAYDPVFIGAIVRPNISFLAKSELFKNKLAGRLLSHLQAIPVRRGKLDRKALRTVEERLAAGGSVLIFPEGTRKSQKARPGTGKFALEMKKDILPILIENSDALGECIRGKKKLRFIIGDIIKINQFADLELNKENYQMVSNHVLEKINELKDRD